MVKPSSFAFTFVAEVDDDVLPEVESVYHRPEHIGDHAGALDFDVQVVMASLNVVDLGVSSNHV